MRLFTLLSKYFTTKLNPIVWYQFLIRNPRTRTLAIILTLVYFISPIDFIPDFIPFLGWIDDALLASIFFGELLMLLQNSMNNRRKYPYTDKQ
jgi:uncharacterized membrane protein YkvA (DUF1232 family)